MNRIEVLAGPQGTLFGASSQAGTVRLITNKPDFSGTYGNVKLGTSFTKGGEMSNSATGVFNTPVTDKLALRGVVYVDRMGGYIDNVAGTLSTRESARFRPAGTVRSNGVPVSAAARRLPVDGSDLSAVELYRRGQQHAHGRRLQRCHLLGLPPRGHVHHQRQLGSAGVAHAPAAGCRRRVLLGSGARRLRDHAFPERQHRRRVRQHRPGPSQGRLGALEVLYTGAFTDRQTDQLVDYSDYLFVGQYLPYYICDSSVSYPGDAAPSGTCQAPDLFVKSTTNTEVMTHEIRFNTPEDRRLRATVGGLLQRPDARGAQRLHLPGLDARRRLRCADRLFAQLPVHHRATSPIPARSRTA
jgi:iron complex outermembrane receptor protein